MKTKLITTATNLNDSGYLQFKRSLEHFGWEYEVMSDNYVAYGSKMKNAYEYAKKTDCTHLFIVDAYDIFMLGTMEQALKGIDEWDALTFNTEKACWPFSEWAEQYPDNKNSWDISERVSTWKYLNGGACFVSVPLFIKLFEENPILDTDNDQEKLGWLYINHRDKYKMKLDIACKTFQSVAFEDDKDFYYIKSASYVNGRVKHSCFISNVKTKTHPVIIHGNGKTDMSKVYNLL